MHSVRLAMTIDVIVTHVVLTTADINIVAAMIDSVVRVAGTGLGV